MAESIHADRRLRRAEYFGLAQEVEVSDVDPLDELHTGGGWYQIGDEKVQGKDAARAALEALEAE